MPVIERKGYLVPVRVTCVMEVYVEAESPAHAKRLVRDGEWDQPGDLDYAYPLRPTVAGPVREAPTPDSGES